MPDNTPQPAVAPIDSRSSLVDKLDPALRRRLDQALINRQPATYRATYDHFQLQEKSVSYTAFYYYARRVRVKASLLELAMMTPEDGPHTHELLPEICAQRLLEASLDENASTRRLHRLAVIYRIASHTALERRRLEFQIKRANLQDLDQVKREITGLISEGERIRRQRLEAEAALEAALSPPPASEVRHVDPTLITDENVPPIVANPLVSSMPRPPAPGRPRPIAARSAPPRCHCSPSRAARPPRGPLSPPLGSSSPAPLISCSPPLLPRLSASPFRRYEVSAFRRFDVSAFRRFGVPAFRRFGISTFRHFDVSAFRRFGFSTFRLFDVSAFRRFGISTFRHFDVSAFRRFGISTFRRFGVSAFPLCIPVRVPRPVSSHPLVAACVSALLYFVAPGNYPMRHTL